MTELLRFGVEGGIARLVFDNPRRLNAINAEMWRALPGLLGRVSDSPDIRVLVLEGAGERAFCTGNDISEFDAIRSDPEAAARYNALQRSVAEALQGMQKPIVAALHGYCLGAGFEIALMADIRVGTADLRCGVPAVKLGLPYRMEDIIKLVDVIGLARAREMVLLGRQYAGEDLHDLGILHRFVPDRPALAAMAAELAAELAANAPLSLTAAKVAFSELTRRDRAPDLERARSYDDACYASEDYAEGRAARREKRPPVFRGR